MVQREANSMDGHRDWSHMRSVMGPSAYLHSCRSAEAFVSSVACHRSVGYPKIRSTLTSLGTMILVKYPIQYVFYEKYEF